MLCSLLTSSFLESLLSRMSKFSRNTFADMCTYELMTAFIPLCRATLLPSIKRFLPKEWNDNLIVWRAPFIHCMNLTHFDARSCLSNYADLETNCFYVFIFQWYPVALFDYIFNAAVIEIKIVVTESRYTNLLCGLNDFELLHHWCFQPCYKQNDIAPCGYGHFSVKLEKLYAGMEIHSLLTAFLMDIWKLHFPSRNRCIMCQSCHPLQSLFLKMV